MHSRLGPEGDSQEEARKAVDRALSFNTEDRIDERASGMGIGLILARLTIVRHGGALAVSIPEGRGIEMRVQLPTVEKLGVASLKRLSG